MIDFLSNWQWGGVPLRFFIVPPFLIAVLLFRWWFAHRLVPHLLRRFSKKPTFYDEQILAAIGKPLSSLIFVGGIFFALRIGGGDMIRGEILTWFSAAGKLAAGIVLIWMAWRLAGVAAQVVDDLLCRKNTSLRGQFLPLIRKTLQTTVLVLGILTLLSTLHVDVAGLLTGLGIGGLAIALAAQETLGNFFGSITILADRPFKPGDWIAVGKKIDGVVEHVGFRSTHVRTWSDTLLSIPNKTLSNEIVENYSSMTHRRIDQTISLGYDTTDTQVQEVLRQLRLAVTREQGIDPVFNFVHFVGFSESRPQIRLYYFSKSTDWLEYLAVQERMSLTILRCLKEANVTLGYPTSLLYLQKKDELRSKENV